MPAMKYLSGVLRIQREPHGGDLTMKGVLVGVGCVGWEWRGVRVAWCGNPSAETRG